MVSFFLSNLQLLTMKSRSKHGRFCADSDLGRRKNNAKRLQCGEQPVQQVRGEHSYFQSDSVVPAHPCDHVVAEEIVADSSDSDFECEISCRPNDGWREGRRLVELGTVVDALRKGCQQCGLLLNIVDTVRETRHGLGGWLQILCSNPACNFVNNVPLGKRHGKVWDVNSKFALGM